MKNHPSPLEWLAMQEFSLSRPFSMVMLDERMSKSSGRLGHRLAKELNGDRQGDALCAISSLVGLLPVLRASFSATFVSELVKSLVLNLSPATVETSMAILKQLLLTVPELLRCSSSSSSKTSI